MELNLEEQVKKLKEENELLKQRLSNYTNPSCNKIYYESNKEIINEKKREMCNSYTLMLWSFIIII